MVFYAWLAWRSFFSEISMASQITHIYTTQFRMLIHSNEKSLVLNLSVISPCFTLKSICWMVKDGWSPSFSIRLEPCWPKSHWSNLHNPARPSSVTQQAPGFGLGSLKSAPKLRRDAAGAGEGIPPSLSPKHWTCSIRPQQNQGLADFYGFEAVAPSSNMFSKGDLFKMLRASQESQHHSTLDLPWSSSECRLECRLFPLAASKSSWSRPYGNRSFWDGMKMGFSIWAHPIV